MSCNPAATGVMKRSGLSWATRAPRVGGTDSPNWAASCRMRPCSFGPYPISWPAKLRVFTAIRKMVRPKSATATMRATGIAALCGNRGMRCSRIRASPSISTIRKRASTSGVRMLRIHQTAAPMTTTAISTSALRATCPEAIWAMVSARSNSGLAQQRVSSR